MTDQLPDKVRLRWRAEPHTPAGTKLQTIERVDDLPVDEDGWVRASYNVRIANAAIDVPVAFEATPEMGLPGAEAEIVHPLTVSGQVVQESEIIRDERGEIAHTRMRQYPVGIFDATADAPVPATKGTEPDNPPDLEGIRLPRGEGGEAA